MGFFNKILKGLGFEDEEEHAPVKQKPKQKKVKQENVTASYNLEKYTEVEEKNHEKDVSQEENPPSVEFEHVKVISQVDVQNVVQKIKRGQSVLINMELMSTADITRSLDFVSGAVYALGLSMQKVDDKLYIIR